MFGRTTKYALLGLGMLAATLLATTTSASGQDADATLDVTIRYPNGQLVTDVDVCATYFFGDGNGLEGFFSGTTGAEGSVPVNSGGQYAVRVEGCSGSANGLQAATWHNGQPAGTSLYSQLWERLIANDMITAVPGANQIDITVGASEISGQVTGPNASSCVVTVIGTSAISGDTGPVAYSAVQSDGSWEAFVHPGDYRAEVSCFLRSAYEAWPNKAYAGDASTITVANNASRTGINFDITDRFDEETGTNLFVSFATDEEFALPKCVEAYLLDGTLARQGFSSSTSVANNGSYRVKIADCFEIGFGDTWYKNATTAANAEVIVVDGEFGETSLEGITLGGPGFFDCNGEEITIRGTAGNDNLRGTPQRDVISGLGGNDTITALGGDDIICGGAGNDRILGNAGADWIDAGAGDDWVGAGWGNDTVYGGTGDDFIRGFKHDDFVDGGPGADRIKGGWGNDVLRGGTGNDIIRAYFGADQLFGDAGNDVLRAGNGPDLLVGGLGPADRLYGEQGKDDCRDVGDESVFTECEKVNDQ